ncbi:hypothetical protein F4824DRAFT_354640 [Ustulina deusta]|nr:hypothetical protein F4824DRAFT_354640 [Ustulina deusta]
MRSVSINWGVSQRLPDLSRFPLRWVYGQEKNVLEFFYKSFYQHAWLGIIEEYAKTALTYESYRRVAISEIARIALARNQNRYVAGIWPRYFIACLLRHCESPVTRGPTMQESSPKVGPSWSWATARNAVG